MNAKTADAALALRDPRTPARLRLALGALAHMPVGSLELHEPGGRIHRLGEGPEGPRAVLELHDVAALDALYRRGDLGLAESYIDGQWSSPDLAGLLTLGALNEAAFRDSWRGHWWYRLGARVLHRLRDNTPRGARRNIASHYDLGNDFYRLWLDPTMTYSCALFESADAALETAQQTKYRRIVDGLALGPDDHVLEIGCGWGGFAIEAVRRSGCRVTGITLSREQLEYARRAVDAAGLSSRIHLELRDYRDLQGRFDHIVSIEMLEAVGERYWPRYFRAIREHLEPGGQAAIQVITIADEAYDGYRRSADFIQTHVFPGGMLPSPRALDRETAGAGLRTARCAFFGEHYARTLAMWDRRVHERRDAILSLDGYDARFLRLWHYYLAYCQAGFRTGRVDLAQMFLEHD